MASFVQFFLLITSLVLILMAMSMESTVTVSARSLPTEQVDTNSHPHYHLSTSTLAVRLQSNSSSECWESLIELKACTGEVILFFLNGETYLGSNCCRAIQIIQHKCWPAMLDSLGFTPEESNILRGYCDATINDDNAGSVLSTPSRPSLPIVLASEDPKP